MQVASSDEIQRFTIRLSYQQGRKLGLVLRDVPNPESEVDNESDGSPHIQGGDPAINNHDAIAPPKVPAHNSMLKGKRCVSILKESIIFDFAKDICTAANNRSDLPGSLDEIVEWGRMNVVARDTSPGHGDLDMDDINDDSLKFVLAGAIKPGDIVEKIEHTIPTRFRKKPNFRSDHLIIVHFDDKSRGVSKCTEILRNPKCYPLYLTLRRVRDEAKSIPPSSSTKRNDADKSCNHPMQKRLKTSESTIGSKVAPLAESNERGAKVTHEAVEDLTCLLDSPGVENKVANAIAMEADSACTDSNSSSQSSSVLVESEPPLHKLSSLSHHKTVSSNPNQMPHCDHDFVLTTSVPIKILYLNSNLSQSNQLVSSIQNQSASTGQELKAALTSLDAVTAERDALKSQLEELNTYSTEVARLKEIMRSFEAANETISNELKSKDAHIFELKESLKNVQTNIDALIAARTSVASLEEKLVKWRGGVRTCDL